MSGPLEREFAQVRKALSMWLRGEPPQTGIGMGHGEVIAALSSIERHVQDMEKALARAVYLGEHLHQMIPREVWRDHGAEWMGQYEGDYHAEQVRDELAALVLDMGEYVEATGRYLASMNDPSPAVAQSEALLARLNDLE